LRYATALTARLSITKPSYEQQQQKELLVVLFKVSSHVIVY